MGYSSILDVVLTSPLIALLLGSIVAYFAIKRLRKEVICIVYSIISEQKAALKTELEAWLNSETGQRAIYGIGSLAGAGIISGTGLQKKSGKFSWQNLIGDIARGWLEKKGFVGGERQALNKESKKPIRKIPEAH